MTVVAIATILSVIEIALDKNPETLILFSTISIVSVLWAGFNALIEIVKAKE